MKEVVINEGPHDRFVARLVGNGAAIILEYTMFANVNGPKKEHRVVLLRHEYDRVIELMGRQCRVGKQDCPNWRGWTEEVGHAVTKIDQEIADLSSRVVEYAEQVGTEKDIQYTEGRIDALNWVRDQL